MSTIANLHTSLPNFFILGAAKAGTTTLFDLLNQHPQVFFPYNKEPMYFCADANYAKGLEWYAKTYFHGSESYDARGEASPHYLYWSEETSKRIKDAYPDESPKFVLIFRDPVKRAYSWYWNMIKENVETLPFEQALEREESRIRENIQSLQRSGSMHYGYARGSMYYRALLPYLEIFNKESFLFLLQDDLDEDFDCTIGKLVTHLKISPDVVLHPQKSNPASISRIPGLQAWLRRKSLTREVVKRVIPLRLRYTLKAFISSKNSKKMDYPPLSSEVEQGLRESFAPDVIELQQVIERDLSRWLP